MSKVMVNFLSTDRSKAARTSKLIIISKNNLQCKLTGIVI